MKSRMEKYYETNSDFDDSSQETVEVVTRANKNKELYKEVSSLELNDFDINSNVSVIGPSSDEIDIDKIRDMIDKRYNEEEINKSIGDNLEVDIPKISLDETREYDINSILQKAKDNKDIDYETDRLKKLRNTQYDILKSLNVDKKEDEEEEKENVAIKKEQEEKLMDLINTINAKELIPKETVEELDPLDILSDLRGDDENTKVMGALVEAINENQEEETGEIAQQKVENDEDDSTSNHKIVNSFVGTTIFNENDFEDFSDLKDDMKVTKVIIRILIFLAVALFLLGIVALANKYLGLGLF